MLRVVMALALIAGCKAKDKTVEAASEVKDKGTDVVGEARSKLGTVRDKLGAAKDKVVDTASDAFGIAVRAKAELDKVYRSTHAWDLDIEEESAEATREHEAQLDKLPSVSVRGVRVGYEEDAKLSLRGTAYAKHFRASWKRGDRIVRVSFYTQDELDLVAFGELLEKLVPAVNAVL